MWPSGDDQIMCSLHPVEMFSVTANPSVIVYWDIAAEMHLHPFLWGGIFKSAVKYTHQCLLVLVVM